MLTLRKKMLINWSFFKYILSKFPLIFQVFFDQPVQVEPDTYYVASAVLDGAELSYFGQEGMSEVTIGK